MSLTAVKRLKLLSYDFRTALTDWRLIKRDEVLDRLKKITQKFSSTFNHLLSFFTLLKLYNLVLSIRNSECNKTNHLSKDNCISLLINKQIKGSNPEFSTCYTKFVKKISRYT